MGPIGGRKASTTGDRRPLPVLAVLAGVVLVVLLVAVWVLASWTPGWFNLADEDDAAAAAYGEQVEFRLAEELQLIRPNEMVWRLKIQDADINAWLATRLLPWLSHEQELVWPERLSRPQVRFSTGGIDVAIKIQDVLGSDRVISLRFRPEIRDGRLTLHPGGIRMGRLPVPFARSTVDALLRDALDGGEGELGELVATALGDATMEALIPLVDARRVKILGLGLERGAIILEAMTIGPS